MTLLCNAIFFNFDFNVLFKLLNVLIDLAVSKTFKFMTPVSDEGVRETSMGKAVISPTSMQITKHTHLIRFQLDGVDSNRF